MVKHKSKTSKSATQAYLHFRVHTLQVWASLQVMQQPQTKRKQTGTQLKAQNVDMDKSLLGLQSKLKHAKKKKKPSTRSQRITLSLCLLSPLTLWIWCRKAPWTHPSPQKTGKQTKRRKKSISYFLCLYQTLTYPPQTAALTQDKPALAASESQSAQWLIDPAPEPNVNKGLTLLGCLKKEESTALWSAWWAARQVLRLGRGCRSSHVLLTYSYELPEQNYQKRLSCRI